MKVGVVLPTFAWTPEEAWTVARSAAEHGVDGVFAYDHLWPMGNRRRPALAPFPILAAVARSFPSLCVGTLVARIGMVSDDVLIAQFRALAAVAPGRVIAAIGTGDKLSAQENLAYGIGFDPAEVRRTSLRSVMATLLDDGLEGFVVDGSAGCRWPGRGGGGGGLGEPGGIGLVAGAHAAVGDALQPCVRDAELLLDF